MATKAAPTDSARVGSRAYEEYVNPHFEIVKEVRGLGLRNGIEFQPPKKLALRTHPAMFGQVLVMRMIREKNILTQICGNNFMVLKAAPPLPVQEEHLEIFVSAIRDVVRLADRSPAFWTEALALRSEP